MWLDPGMLQSIVSRSQLTVVIPFDLAAEITPLLTAP
jgi:hypothetical protein